MPRVIHFEIHAADPERAVKFYSRVFGWEFQKWDGPADYWLIRTGPTGQPGIDGGLLRRQGGAPADCQAVNAFVCTVDVPSLDEFFTKALDAGAAVALPKMPVPGVGWLAYVKDPEGNILGLMQMDRTAK
jgi:predicted enzyme related to lactoylglutathione lyase